MSIADLSVVNDGMVRVYLNTQNKTYVQNFKDSVIIHGASGGPVDGLSKTPFLINLFPEVSIQANKSFIIDTFVKAYVSGASGDTDFLGLNVATNIKINDTWYSLGNSGRVVSANRGGSGMATYAAKKFLDFENLLGKGYVSQREPYTVQVELVGSCDASGSANIAINANHDVGGTYPTGWTGVDSIEDQNFTTVIIEEID